MSLDGEARGQCGLCLSCGAPFLPNISELSFYGRRGNLSVLYINEAFKRSAVLQRMYQKPVFCGPVHRAHIFHKSHHEALDYMCKHHTRDNHPTWPGGRSAVQAHDGPMPYKRSKTVAELCVWAKPPAGHRLDFGPLLEFMRAPGRPAAYEGTNWEKRYLTCMPCNALMTGLSYTRFLVGFDSAALKNTLGPLIPLDEQPLTARKARAGNYTFDSASGHWTVVAGAADMRMPERVNKKDPLAPHVAYALHLCMPFEDGAAADPFPTPAARRVYLELSWLILQVAHLLRLIECGKLNDEDESHGIQQHYGALDMYVSFFLWHLMRFEFGKRCMLPDFVQWHQKYFWEAIRMPAFDGRGFPTVGIAACPTVGDADSRGIFERICAALMRLYQEELRPLILVVARQACPAGVGAGNMQAEYDLASRYFVNRGALHALLRRGAMLVSLGCTPVRARVCLWFCTLTAIIFLMMRQGNEHDFEAALETFGVTALMSRSIQLSPEVMRPMLKDFCRNWQRLEIDRIRTKGDGLSMTSAYTLYTMCNLLDPPDEIPDDKAVAAGVLAGPVCSPWVAALSLAYLGAFTDD